jgi:hypothetical protein
LADLGDQSSETICSERYSAIMTVGMWGNPDGMSGTIDGVDNAQSL